MPKWLHLLVLLAVLLVFGASFALLQRVIGITSPWLAMLLMFYFLGLAKVAEPLFMLRVPSALRRLRPWELKGDVHRWLAVPAFGSLLRRTPLRYLNSAVYLNQSRRDPLKVCLQVESGEAAHFWAAVLLMPYIGYAGLNGELSVVGWFLLAQVLVNLYPILHLRLVRGRLGRLVTKKALATFQAAQS
jgi:hypothetical protein